MPQLAPLLTIASTAVAAAGTYASAQGEKRSAEHAASVATMNAQVQRESAEAARRDAIEADFNKRREDRRLRASQISGFAGGGVTSAGTPLAVLGETAGNQQRASKELLKRGAYTARNREIETANFLNSASSSRYEASQYASAGNIATFGTVLSGASKLQGQYVDYRRNRPTGY